VNTFLAGSTSVYSLNDIQNRKQSITRDQQVYAQNDARDKQTTRTRDPITEYINNHYWTGVSQTLFAQRPF